MTIEIYIDDENYLKEGLTELNSILNDNINKEMIINTINFHINSSTWPTDYYKLRDEVIPGVYGEKVSKAFFWSIFGGWMVDNNAKMYLIEEAITKNNFAYLNYLTLTYGKTFIKAKGYNSNPLGFSELNFGYSGDNDIVNLIFSRNDNNNLLFEVNSKDVLNITSNLVHYYNELAYAKGINLNEEEKDKILNLIVILRKLSEVKYGK